MVAAQNNKGEGHSPLHLFTAEHITRLFSRLTCRLVCVLKLIHIIKLPIYYPGYFST